MGTSEVCERIDFTIAGHSAPPAGGEYLEDIDPANGETIALVARGGATDIDSAVEAAREGFRSWSALIPSERAVVLNAIGDRINHRAEEFALLESRDTGKPLSQARRDIQVSARYFHFYAGIADKIYGETIPIDGKSFAFTLREPLGVTAHILPWNYPMQIGCRTIATSLATANACVVKPAEDAPLTISLLATIALEAGLPPGALNVVSGLGEEAGAALASHPGVDRVFFTGSPEVGALVQKMAADNITPVSLELGGKSPNIVFADAQLESALPVVLQSLIQNAGQTCSAGTRLLVQSPVEEMVKGKLRDLMGAVQMGPGVTDPDMGPLISGKQLDRVLGYLEIGRNEGASVLTGGGRPAAEELGRGYFVEPTLLDGVNQDMRVANEEIFGPVLSVLTFEEEEEAAAIANGSPYGLIAAIWTRDINKAFRLARSLDCGQVYVNSYGAGGGADLPFGGYKRSGYGREKGVEAVREYTQVKTVAVQVE
ncbi:MAG: aldehyde dehydrogenase family protein [Dehalococcoidia bacterium]|nr:aldehyde dehydrogenase family protein [Dehalococcoidia bacterium]